MTESLAETVSLSVILFEGVGSRDFVSLEESDCDSVFETEDEEVSLLLSLSEEDFVGEALSDSVNDFVELED